MKRTIIVFILMVLGLWQGQVMDALSQTAKFECVEGDGEGFGDNGLSWFGIKFGANPTFIWLGKTILQ